MHGDTNINFMIHACGCRTVAECTKIPVSIVSTERSQENNLTKNPDAVEKLTAM